MGRGHLRHAGAPLVVSIGVVLLALASTHTLLAAEQDQDLPLTNLTATFDPDLFTGALQGSIPIQVPPGRNGIQPNLNLTYWSGSGNGWAGMGWKLELGAIERQTRFGVDYGGDAYTFRLNGASADLVTIGNGEYRAKVEGAFARIRKLTAGDGQPYWEATDKKGIRYLFGQTAASRMADPADASRIFRWCLDRVEDPNGNYMTLTYWSDQGQSYLSQIDYTGNGTLSPTNQVKFYLESRPDATAMYTTNFQVRTGYRLKTIDVLANGQRLRAYRLSYTTSSSTARSLLARVDLFGRDATLDGSGTVTGGSVLPAVLFSYQQNVTALTATVTPIPNSSACGIGTGFAGLCYVGYSNGSQRAFVADFNGDGKADILRSSDVDGENTLYLSNGTSFTAYPTVIPDSSACGIGTGFAGLCYLGQSNATQRTHVGDFNGDGKADLLRSSDVDGENTLYLSNGTSFTAYPTVIPDSSACGIGTGFAGLCYLGWSNATQRAFVADFDGDGKADILRSSDVPGENTLFLSTGTGFTAYPTVIPNSSACMIGTPYAGQCYLGHSNGSQRTIVADFNGDGKADLLRSSDFAGENTLYLSNGTSFTAYPTVIPNSSACMIGTPYAGPCYLGHSNGSQRTVVADFNGDGKADLLRSSDFAGENTLYLSTGTGFAAYPTPIPNSSACGIGTGFAGLCYLGHSNGTQRTHVGDFNGDGKADLLRSSDVDGENTLYLSNGTSFTVYPTVIPDSAACGIGTGFAGLCYLGWSNGTQRAFVADFDGDGKADLLRSSDVAGENTWYQSSPGGVMNDLLVQITNGLGGTITVTYLPSTQYANAQLPFMVATVSAITTDDGNGTISTTSYTYSGGFYHIGERDFRGFNYVKVTGPVGPNGEQAITETWFHQGNDTDVDQNMPNVPDGYQKGRPYRVQVSDGQGRLYTETTTSYTPDADGAAPFFTPPEQVDTTICDGTACGKQTRVVYAYDDFGNVIREDQYGDLADPADDRTIARTFALNTTAWITGLPASETIYQGLSFSTQVARTDFYYDGVASCAEAATSQTPTQGNVTRIVRWLSGGTSPERRLAYDAFGNKVCTRDANGNQTTYAYDSSATFLTVETNALGRQRITQYYGVDGVPADLGLYGQVKRVTDPNGAVAAMEYDGFGRRAKVTQPDGFWTMTSYVSFGTVGAQHVQTDTALGLSTWTYFDGLGRPFFKRNTGPDGKLVARQTQYDVRGAATRTSLPYFDGVEAPQWTSGTYDPVGRVLQTTNPDGSRTLTCHDDWVTVTLDANNHRKRETRDAYGRLLKVEEYLGTFSTCDTTADAPYATTVYDYDVLGHLRFVLDAKANLTEIRYDTLGRKTFMHDPDMGDWTYAYDAAGNLVQQTDADEESTYFQYDALHRRRQKDFCLLKPLGSGDVVYTYDGATANGRGRLTSVLDSSGTTVFFYDLLGRTVRTDKTVDGVTYTTQSAYDGLGRVTTLTYPDGSAVTYTYNGPQLDRVAEGATVYGRYAGYNALGEPATLTVGNGVVTSYTYQPATFRLSGLSTVNGSTTLQSLGYGYDAGGNVTAITDAVNGGQSFAYDALDRLVTATGPYGSHSYSYDELGNLTFNPLLGAVTYPASGTGSVHPHAVSTAGPNSYIYDANGNLIAGAGRTLAYDYENRPVSITQDGTTTTFVYDGDGGRVKKVEGAKTTLYIGKLYVCEFEACAKLIFAGSQRLAMKQVGSGTVSYFHADHLGSTSVLTNASGVVEQSVTYYPFGATRTNSGTADVRYKYTGQELDTSTGLYFYGARYYDATLGRFLSADTIVPNPRDPQALNRYSYVSNNPLIHVDPTGHFSFNPSKFLRRALGPIGSQIAIATIAVAAAYFTAGAASAAFLETFNVAVGPPTFALATTANVVGGLAGGVVGGGLAGALQGGNFNRALSGALGGGISGGIFGGLGPVTSGWDYAAKAATYGVAGGVSSAARGGNFTLGLASSLAVSVLTSAALQMRYDMIEQSRLNPANSSGESEGFDGDRFKLGGVRWVEGVAPENQSPDLPILGGRQGGQGYLFGIPYSPGSFADHLVETFAGPHDFLNSFTWYNYQGNALNLTGIPAFGGEILNAANVFLSAPFAAASVIPGYAYPLLGQHRW